MKKLTIMLFAAAAFTFTACDKREAAVINSVAAGDVSQRIGYFASHGWEVEEISEKNILIPSDFSDIYEEYARMQDKQGLPLREYSGRNAKLYVYEVKNYSPENMRMLAELVVCDDKAVASMVYSEDCGSIKLPVS